MGDRLAAGQLSACLLAFVVLGARAGAREPRTRALRERAAQVRASAAPLRRRGSARFAACAMPVLLGFLLPTALLLQLAWSDLGRTDPHIAARLLTLVGNSFISPAWPRAPAWRSPRPWPMQRAFHRGASSLRQTARPRSATPSPAP